MFYTYKIIFNDGHYYYGMRKSIGSPEEDIYWGSPKTHKDKWRTMMYSKEIINVYTDCTECAQAEIELIKPVYRADPLCLNENFAGWPCNLNNTGRPTGTTKFARFGETKVIRVPAILAKSFTHLCDTLHTLPERIDPVDLIEEFITKLQERDCNEL